MIVLQPPGTYLAQLNVGRTLDAMDTPQLAGFRDNLDRINALAERSPGFVWRLKDDGGNATNIKLTNDPLFIVNLSVWQTPAQLEHFVWNTVHKRFYDQKAQWFEAPERRHFVMWWVPVGHLPPPDEALARLAELESHGSTARAFSWEDLASAERH